MTINNGLQVLSLMLSPLRYATEVRQGSVSSSLCWHKLLETRWKDGRRLLNEALSSPMLCSYRVFALAGWEMRHSRPEAAELTQACALACPIPQSLLGFTSLVPCPDIDSRPRRVQNTDTFGVFRLVPLTNASKSSYRHSSPLRSNRLPESQNCPIHNGDIA